MDRKNDETGSRQGVKERWQYVLLRDLAGGCMD